MAAGLRVAIAETGKLQELLGRHRGDDARTTRSGNETHPDASTFASEFRADGMGLVEFRSPIAEPDGDEGHFRGFDRALDRVGDFGGGLPSEPDEADAVSDRDERFESRPLTGGGLLLDGHDLHDLVLQFALTGRSTKKMLDNIIFFNA